MTPRDRLGAARLYLVCDARPVEWLRAALRGGVDMIQLRDGSLGDGELVAAARAFRTAADEVGALFILNDRPTWWPLRGRGGRGRTTHAGATRGGRRRADRRRSTHAPSQENAARRTLPSDYLAVGPVPDATTRPPGGGTDYVS